MAKITKADSGPEFLTVNETANLLRVTPLTLRNWRRDNFGPPWCRIGQAAIRYRRSTLMGWLDRLESAPEKPPKDVAARQSLTAVE